MKQLKIVNGFPELTDAKLLARALGIQEGLSGQPDVFIDPTPSLGTLATQVTAFQAAMLAAVGGSLQQKAVRDQTRLALIDTLHSLGNYVLFTVNGNLSIALLSGFRVAKDPEPTGPVLPAEDLTLKPGIASGELLLKFKKVQSAKSYIYEITTSPVTANSIWVQTVGTKRKQAFTGLQRGQDYCARVAAVGINGQLVYSPVVIQMAL